MSVINFSDIVNEKLASEVAERWRFTSGRDLSIEDGPTPWLCEGLAIAPGPVTIVGGAGFGGKTVSMQALLLAVASGKSIWGHFPVRKGIVKHIDYEQGKPLTKRRYQRLARWMGIDLCDLEEILHLSSMPTTRLDDDCGERELTWILQGVTVAIIDAFRGAFPKATENDSGVRMYLDMLGRVSANTGCTIIVIAHSKKLQAGADDDVRSSLRGSGALYDAAQGVWMLDGMRGKPTRAHHTKERLEGELKETFGLVISDVPDPCLDGGLKWGLSVEYLSAPELQAAYDRADRADNSIAINAERIETIGLRILEILSRAPDGLMLHTVKGMLFGERMSDVMAAMPVLVQSGAVYLEGGVYRAMQAREPGID